MSALFDHDLQARAEDAGINASAPREQLWIDGWLVRRCPGKAKRARCIQAVAPGRMGIDDKLTRCAALYAEAGLRLYVRVTPFSQPAGLDDQLSALGMERIDDTRVMLAPLPVKVASNGTAHALTEPHIEEIGGDAFAQWVGEQRGSSASEWQAHAGRLRESPVPYRALVVRDGSGGIVAGGQVAIELDLAGLYDVFTTATARCQGHSQALCRRLLTGASERGARWAYLQVESDNAAARHVYQRLGFADAYSYHYRSPPAP